MIIVDDGSTDESDLVINRLLDEYPQLIYVKHKNNLGIAQPLNTGLAKAEENASALSCLSHRRKLCSNIKKMLSEK